MLGRTNAQVQEAFDYLTYRGIPCDTFKQADLSNSEILEKSKENTVKVLTIHSSKGLEAPCVIVRGAQYYNKEEKSVSYVAATRAKHVLIWLTNPKKKKKKKKQEDIFNWE